MKYLKVDNVFLKVDDFVRAQRLADGFAGVDWVRVFGRYARQINPLLGGLLSPMRCYWVTSQSEYSEVTLYRLWESDAVRRMATFTGYRRPTTKTPITRLRSSRRVGEVTHDSLERDF